jgi:Na+/proline symporter
VSVTQKQQMAVMMGGMILAGIVVVYHLPENLTFSDSVALAGKLGKFNLVDFNFDFTNRYNFWSGITGGLFLALSYFGTDQSQVARYLTGSVTESRLGLLFNGLLKIPMQFIILFIGLLVFVFYLYVKPPVFFNSHAYNQAYTSGYQSELDKLQGEYDKLFKEKKSKVKILHSALTIENEHLADQTAQEIHKVDDKIKTVRTEVKEIIAKADPDAELKDTDYVFLTFILNHMPSGIVGLLLAVIMSAAMSSTSAELNALASTTTVDIYKRSVNQNGSEKQYLNASRLFTVMWGIIAIGFALVASLFENLIQLVNLLGSLFYGTILGIFLAAFYFKFIKSNAVFIAALIAEVIVLLCYWLTDIGFLWFNVIGCVLVVAIASVLSLDLGEKGDRDILDI